MAEPKKVWDGVKQGFKKGSDTLLESMGAKTLDDSSNGGNSGNNGKSNSDIYNSPQHGDSFKSDMSNSTTSEKPTQETKAEIYRTEQKSKIDATFGERALGWAGKAKGMCDSCRSGR